MAQAARGVHPRADAGIILFWAYLGRSLPGSLGDDGETARERDLCAEGVNSVMSSD